jgi:hypothetical protein
MSVLSGPNPLRPCLLFCTICDGMRFDETFEVWSPV